MTLLIYRHRKIFRGWNRPRKVFRGWNRPRRKCRGWKPTLENFSRLETDLGKYYEAGNRPRAGAVHFRVNDAQYLPYYSCGTQKLQSLPRTWDSFRRVVHLTSGLHVPTTISWWHNTIYILELFRCCQLLPVPCTYSRPRCYYRTYYLVLG
jgi:hypothetical protein